MKKSQKFRIENLILLTLVVVSIVLVCISAKITFLGLDMFILWDNVVFYNESEHKTDDGQAYYNQNDAKRQAFYESEDNLVRGFSNMSFEAKVFGCLVAAILLVGIPGIWIYCIAGIMKATGTRRHRRRSTTRRRAHM